MEPVLLTEEEKMILLAKQEGHFLDFKAIEVKPASLSKHISAFANTAGGELFIGVDEVKTDSGPVHSWRGFNTIEDANAILAVLEDLGGTTVAHPAFLMERSSPGLILHLIIKRNKVIVSSTDRTPYVRRGAQSLPVDTDEKVRRLRLDKGVESFEDETVAIPLDNVTNSVTVLEFMIEEVPSGEPDTWLRSQFLIDQDKPTVASILLFSDEPQAAIPKRAAIKIFRYKTVDNELDRDALVFEPITIEGPICDLIREAVEQTKSIVEGIKSLTSEGLEYISYPDETLHEIITNAVLHRDYSIATDAQIRIYDDRVEVYSPGRLPGQVTVANVLDEQSARNPKIVRMANKFPNPPNKDVGEGLNTAFEAMRKIRLQDPEIVELDNAVVVYVRHKRLASPHQIVMEYLETNASITNQKGREITGIRRDVQMKDVFVALRNRGLLEMIEGSRGRASAWKKPSGASTNLILGAPASSTHNERDLFMIDPESS